METSLGYVELSAPTIHSICGFICTNRKKCAGTNLEIIIRMRTNEEVGFWIWKHKPSRKEVFSYLKAEHKWHGPYWNSWMNKWLEEEKAAESILTAIKDGKVIVSIEDWNRIVRAANEMSKLLIDCKNIKLDENFEPLP